MRRVSLVIFLLSFIPASYADQDSERERLSLLVMQLDRINQEVVDMSKAAPLGSKVVFNYEIFREDLAKIRNGIADYVDGSLMYPRTIAPVVGNYTERN